MAGYAFGQFKGSLTGTATSIGTSIAAATGAGDLAVNVGDLIVCVVGQQTDMFISSVTDNIVTPTTYTAQDAGFDGTAFGVRAFWFRCTTVGTLSSVTATISPTGGTENGAIIAVLYAGQFVTSPLDVSPASAADVTSPFNCPATGTLAQPNEMIIGWGCASGNAAWSGTAPFALDIQVATASILKVALGHLTVAATDTVTNQFTSGTNPGEDILGTMSFKQVPVPLTPGQGYFPVPE